MVLFVYSGGRSALPSCGPSPAPLPPSVYWEQAAAAHQARLTLPAFSVLDARHPSDIEPHAVFERFAAALPLDSAAGGEWAHGLQLCPLSSLHGPGDALQTQPQQLELPQQPGDEAVPTFLLLRGRTPLTDGWRRHTAAAMDVPCLPSRASDEAQETITRAILGQLGEGSVEQATLPPVNKEKFQARPRLMPSPQQGAEATAATQQRQPFCLLDSLLQLEQPWVEGGGGAGASTSLELLDVPVPVSHWQQQDLGASASPCSLRIQLGQLAAGCFQGAATSADNTGPSGTHAGFIPLKELGGCSSTAARQEVAGGSSTRMLLGAPTPMQYVERPGCASTSLPSFLLTGDPPAAGPGTDAASPSNINAPHPASQPLLHMEAPVLPTDPTVAARAAGPLEGAPAFTAFSHLFHPVPVPEVSAQQPLRCFAPDGCQPTSLAALIAQDLVLDDGGLVLPAVLFGEGEDLAESAPATLLPLVQSECGCKPASVAHLALYMDWSLSSQQGAGRPPDLAAASRRLRQQLLPRRYVVGAARAAEQESRYRQALIGQLVAPYQQPGGSVEFAHAACKQRMAAPKVQVGHMALQNQQPAAAAAANAKPAAGSPPAKRTKRGATADGMQYFLQLQRGAGGGPGKGAAAAGALLAAGAAPATSSSSGADTEEAVELYQQQASTAVHSIQLPDSHTKLLCLLREDEARLVASAPAPGVAPEVARSHYLSVDFLQRALEQAAGKPSKKGLLEVYAAMAVVRQTAACLVHHGIRTAHLYLSHSQSELPGLLAAVTAARELKAAYQQVEKGQLEDSPKHAALQRVLGGMAALTPGCRCCIIGDPKSFFALYQWVLGSGQHVSQFDRDGRLLASGASSRQLAAAVAQACGAGGGPPGNSSSSAAGCCLLVDAQLVARGGFPLASFQCVVVYASEPDIQEGLVQHLEGLACPLHVMEVAVPTQQQPQAHAAGHPKQQAAAATAVAAGQMPVRPLPAQPAPAAVPALPAGVVRVQHAARPAPVLGGNVGMGGAVGLAAAAAAGARPGSRDWPIIVSSDPCRPLRCRRQLYEAVLALEREGAAVLERRLALVDAVLSPSAGLVVCDNTSRKLEFEAFLSALSPVLARLSYAFSRVVLVCEGSTGFQAQVLCGMGRLLALGRRYGLQLQCHVTTSSEATAAVVGSVARACLAKWRGTDPGAQYGVTEEPSEQEAFLTRFYSLNPHSATLLLSLGLSLRQLLCLSSLNPLQLPKALSLLPKHCLDLFLACTAHGTPVLGIPSALPPGQMQQASAATPGSPPAVRLVQPSEAGAAYMSPAQASCVPGMWQQQRQQQQYQQQAAGGQTAAWQGAERAQHVQQVSLQVPAHQAAYQMPAQHDLYTFANPPEYAQEQAQQQQQQRGGGGYEPPVEMTDAVYHQGMQLMQQRLRSQPNTARVDPGPTATAGWTPVRQQQQQQGQQAYAVQGSSDWSGYATQQLLLMQQQQEQNDLQQQWQQLQCQQYRAQQLQAEAANFPELNASMPDWDGAETAAGAGLFGHQPQQQQRQDHYQQQQQQVQARGYQQLPGLPPLPPGRVGASAFPAGQAMGAAYGRTLHHSSGPAWGGYHQQMPGQQQVAMAAGVDEFGVSVQPSISDDESDNAVTMQAPGLQQLGQQFGYGSSAAAAAAGAALGPGSGMPTAAWPAAAAAAAAAPGGSGIPGEGGSMAAFLGSRKREFTVPRMPRGPLASRQLTPQQQPHVRGAAQRVAGFDMEEGGEEPAGPAAKRPRGAAGVAASASADDGGGRGGGHNNLLRASAAAGRGGYKRQGGGGRGGGGGRRGGGGGGGWKGGYRSNKPSRAW